MTEQQARFNLGNTMYAYHFAPKTTEDLLVRGKRKVKS
jgi:hypothetical protein